MKITVRPCMMTSFTRMNVSTVLPFPMCIFSEGTQFQFRQPPSFHHSQQKIIILEKWITGATRQVQLVKQELLTLMEHLRSPPVFSGVCVAWSLVFCFVNHCLSFCLFSLGHCIVCPLISDYPFTISKLFLN